MSLPLLILVTLCYFGIGIDQLFHSNYSMSLVWIGYALANCGLMKFL